MNRFHWVLTGLLGVTFWMYAGNCWAQQSPESSAPAHMIVTAEPKHGNNAPTINREDVKVFEGRDRDTVTDWIPAQGDHAALELFILLDGNSSSSLGSQLEDLRQFIAAQPATRSEEH